MSLHNIGPDYLVMEFVDGTPLRGPLTLAAAREYALQIADALDTAHRKGIVRDLKPDNILLTASGIKLLDFGLAKFFTTDPDAQTQVLVHVTQEGLLLGTIPYMSPEQAEGRHVDERSDMFSFGTVLYELLSGARPFDGGTQAEILAAVLRDEPRPLKTTHPEIPESVSIVIDKCLRKHPSDRYRTAADLRAALTGAQWESANKTTSVVVLPFVNANRDEDGEFFADGVTEDLISALAKLQGLRVVARSTAFPFKGRTAGYEEVRETLHMGTIVEGSVRRAGSGFA